MPAQERRRLVQQGHAVSADALRARRADLPQEPSVLANLCRFRTEESATAAPRTDVRTRETAVSLPTDGRIQERTLPATAEQQTGRQATQEETLVQQQIELLIVQEME